MGASFSGKVRMEAAGFRQLVQYFGGAWLQSHSVQLGILVQVCILSGLSLSFRIFKSYKRLILVRYRVQG
jgi:hypothetical protein